MRLSRELARSLVRPFPAIQTLQECWFPVAVALYLLLIGGIRTLAARSLMIDESEQLALSQVLSLGYGSQPPLVVWVVWVATALFGPTAATVIAVRFAILGLMYAGLYTCGRAVTATPGKTALAAAAALFVPAVSWDFVFDKTNTPAACAFAALTVAALIRAVRSDNVRWAVAAGVFAGLGVLSKYTFIPFVAGLFAASLTIPQYRRWVLSSRGVIASAMTTVVVLPHVIWVLTSQAELAESITHSITHRPGRTFGMLLTSAGDVVAMSCGFTLLVFAIIAPGVYSRKANLTSESRLLGRALLLASVAAIVVVVLAGGNRLKAHWFTPLAVLLPTYLITRLDFVPVPRLRLISLWCAVVGTVVGVTLAAGVLLGTDLLAQGRHLRERDQLAAEVSIAFAERPDSIVCDAFRDAGNLRFACPDSVVAVLSTPSSARPALRGSVVLVWDASKSDDIPDLTTMMLARDYGLRPDPFGPVSYLGERPSSANRTGHRLGVVTLVRVVK
ncbi:MAG: hypothetical protein C0467_00765 [Planctomycetaceae bacterium]|nr:hypothetical protein [Planctomycetaceae bacterium]